MLKVRNLKKYFGGVKAVNGCSFEVKKGKITSLIGPNGSGKTTIFNVVCGILKPDSGAILLDNKDITKQTPEKISQEGISRLFQQSRLFQNLTINENLDLALDEKNTHLFKNLFGLYKLSEEKKSLRKKFLEEVGMKRFEHKMTGELSYGQKRLIELIRTILSPHKMLILDEPVGGVSPFLRKKIKKILLELKKNGETIFLIEHNINFIMNISDEIIVMDEGKIVTRGPPKEIMRNKKFLSIYF